MTRLLLLEARAKARCIPARAALAERVDGAIRLPEHASVAPRPRLKHGAVSSAKARRGLATRGSATAAARRATRNSNENLNARRRVQRASLNTSP
jgi:hypothetical protein